MSAPAATKIELAHVGIIPWYWNLYVGMEKGFLAQHGLAPEVSIFETGSQLTPAVQSGDINIALLAPDVLIRSSQFGSDLTLIGGVITTAPYSLVVPGGTGGYADLRGQRLAVAGVKDLSTLLLRDLLQQNGLGPDDYEFIQSGGTASRYAALTSGAATGALLTQPQDLRAQRDGYKILVDMSQLVKNYLAIGLQSKRSWLAANADTAVHFLCAHRQSTAWLYDSRNKQEAIAILAKAINVDDALADDIYRMYISTGEVFPRDGGFTPDAVGKMIQMMAAVGDIEGPPPDPAQFIDFSYLERAQRACSG
jgi:NitT/TauT family transport system substrate-binding protein